MVGKESRYYRARGFSTYYFANAVFNIVRTPMAYMRGIEEILGDARTEWFLQPFKTYTNLHEFVREIISSIILEDLHEPDAGRQLLKDFLRTYGVDVEVSGYDTDALVEALGEADGFHDALEELTDEVFHVLFNDVAFLQKFNGLVASHIELSGDGDTTVRKEDGTLRRVAIPAWARRAIFHRDKGECRTCKIDLAATINQIEFERYDHIVPLRRFGANDVTNLQLLCEACNLKKAAKDEAVSLLYQKALQPR
jgi:hypothetical protein